jgi:hypothetical protein
MTESDWLAATDPAPMLRFLGPAISERKLRLFAAACCRRVWAALPGEGSRDAVVMAERFADGLLDEVGLSRAHATAEGEINPEAFDKENPAYWATAPAMTSACCGNCVGWSEGFAPAAAGATWGSPDFEAIRRRERAGQACLLRCIAGDPFRQPGAGRSHPSPEAVLVAEGIYNDRAFDRLPVLAEALQRGGCPDSDILAHCRGDGPHARGCWVVDLVLGRE